MAPAAPDPYKTLGIEHGADPNAIKKAYKKMALKYHPDKNPDNPNAEKIFTEIQEAYEILQDDKTRAAFDNLMKAKQARDLKAQEMDKKRKAEVDKLNEREEAARRKQDDYGAAERKYKVEIDRMREQNKKMMEAAALKRQMESERKAEAARVHVDEAEAGARRQAEVRTELSRTVKVTWPVKNCIDRPGLESVFHRFGEVDSCVCGKKSGMLVFKSDVAAANAAHAVKAGLVERASELQMSVEWVHLPDDAPGNDDKKDTPTAGGAPNSEGAHGGMQDGAGERPLKRATNEGDVGGASEKPSFPGAGGSAGGGMPSFSSFNPDPAQPGEVHKDYESITMMRMRQAAERKRLAEQMIAEEDAAK